MGLLLIAVLAVGAAALVADAAVRVGASWRLLALAAVPVGFAATRLPFWWNRESSRLRMAAPALMFLAVVIAGLSREGSAMTQLLVFGLVAGLIYGLGATALGPFFRAVATFLSGRARGNRTA